MRRLILIVICLLLPLTFVDATPVVDENTPSVFNAAAPIPTPRPTFVPSPPEIKASAYVLLDASSGKIIAEKNSDARVFPASLTKMMTMYVISDALKSGRIHLTDNVPVSANAWRVGGSKMFIKVGDSVPLETLINGIVVSSGNDASIALAEFVAGSEDSFASLMNQEAHLLGMNNSHFMDSNGLPNAEHYSTAKDIATLARGLVRDFPQYYGWYSQKWFTYNKIRQPNRNRLLWSMPSVDGIKTGHTDEAGYCLVASALQNGMRLISVVMGAPSDNARTQASEALLTYGFRFFETYKVYSEGAVLSRARVFFGKKNAISVGVKGNVFVTIPRGQSDKLQLTLDLDNPLKAPIGSGQTVGQLKISLNNQVIQSFPAIALEDDAKAGVFGRTIDYLALTTQKFFKKSA